MTKPTLIPPPADALKGLLRFLGEEEKGLLHALSLDLGKPPTEAYTSEIVTLKSDLQLASKNSRYWRKGDRLPTPWILFPTRARLLREPVGRVLIFSPWNYPLFLSLSPAIYALACGNQVCLKPSEWSPAISGFLAKKLPSYVDPRLLTVVTGGPKVAQKLLDEPWGMIVFTGGTETGKEVMARAAKTLSPVLLELGGRNPAIVYPDADVPKAARQILWGKMFNGGQTCVAPDHVWVHASVKEAFIRHFLASVQDFYGSNPTANTDIARILSPRHYGNHLSRLRSLKASGSVIHTGGLEKNKSLRVPPCLVETTPEHPAVQQEMFSPILPLFSWDDESELYRRLSTMGNPLAIYPFTGDHHRLRRLGQGTKSGAIAQNQTLGQMFSAHFPFGGVGESGFGRYRGLESRGYFTRTRLILTRPSWPEWKAAYPPYRRPLEVLKKMASWVM